MASTIQDEVKDRAGELLLQPVVASAYEVTVAQGMAGGTPVRMAAFDELLAGVIVPSHEGHENATLPHAEEGVVQGSDPPNMEAPSTALGPLLERALKELKGSKMTKVVGEAKTGSVETKVALSPRSTTPVKALSTPLRRSRRREGSVDEDSVIAASRLKAKKNLDEEGRRTRPISLGVSCT